MVVINDIMTNARQCIIGRLIDLIEPPEALGWEVPIKPCVSSTLNMLKATGMEDQNTRV